MINLTSIRERVDQTIGILEAVPPVSSSGENDVLGQCIGTLKSILEEIDEHGKTIPSKAQRF